MSRCVLVINALLVWSAFGVTLANAQVSDETPGCWLSYANCASASSSDQSWRSICYADFSRCLASKRFPQCPNGGAVPVCSNFLTDCKSLAEGDAVLMEQCEQDADACLLAHGC